MISEAASIDVSLLTSSTRVPVWRIPSLISQDPIDALEIYAFRNTDIDRYLQQGIPKNRWRHLEEITRVADYVAALSRDDIKRISDDILSQLDHSQRRRLRISSLATFFPEIVSVSDTLRTTAVDALVNAARLAHRLEANCVEMVGGVRLDTCDCSHFGAAHNWDCPRVRCLPHKTKLEWLAAGVKDAVPR